jgi:sugar phosphate isomerase/epimerase
VAALASYRELNQKKHNKPAMAKNGAQQQYIKSPMNLNQPSASRRATRRDFLKTAAVLAGTSLAGLAKPLGVFAASESAFQLGCYTRPWDQFEYRVALDGIAEAVFKYAGLMTAKGQSWVIITIKTTPDEAAQIGGEIKQRGLKALSVYGEFSVTESLEAGIQGLKRLIENCAACGSPNLLLGGTSEEKLVKPYYQAVAECCEYAVSKGVGLSVKPHGGQNATGAQCRRIIEQVGHKDFRLWYDPGNIYYYSDGKLDPVTDAATVDGLVVGMSVKDFKPPKEVLVTPGTGQVKFREVFARLKQGGFTRGPLIVECLERGDLAHLTAEAKKARQFLETLTGQQG